MSSSKKDDTEIMDPQGQEINVAGKKVLVKPFVIKNRLFVLRAVTTALQELLSDGKQLSVVNVVDVLGEKVIDIYDIIIDEKREWIENNITLKDETVLIEAILNVNEIDFLLQGVEKILKIIKKD